jgi:hypothetical protein
MHNILLGHLPHVKERNFSQIYGDDCSQKHLGAMLGPQMVQMVGLKGFPLFLHAVLTSRPPLAYINQPKATIYSEGYH